MILSKHFLDRLYERFIILQSEAKTTKEIKKTIDQGLLFTFISQGDGTEIVGMLIDGNKCLVVKSITLGDFLTVLPKEDGRYYEAQTIDGFLKLHNEIERRKQVERNKRKLHFQQSIRNGKSLKSRERVIHNGSSILAKG